MSSNNAQFCTFRLAGATFGIDVLNVQEVITEQRYTRIPCTPPVIRGLINLRGQIVTAIDLRERLGLQPAGPDVVPMNIVVRNGETAVSLIVDQIGDVLEANEASIEPPPAHLDATTRELLTGIFQLENVLLLILDIDRAVDGRAIAEMAAQHAA